MPEPPPPLSALIFNTPAAHNLSHILSDLKRANLSIPNRLRSVAEDAAFVARVRAAFGCRPLVANERCGSWYVPPAEKEGSAYFKSTDGHMGQWGFSLRRLNLQLLPIVGKHDGCILVDSTRRGMPDALSKTVPIWCAVLNRVLFPDRGDAHELRTPPQVVSTSENSHISRLLPSFVSSFEELGLDLVTLRSRITKPLRPLWVTQETDLDEMLASSPSINSSSVRPSTIITIAATPETTPTPVAATAGPYTARPTAVFEDFHPIICCTASRRVFGTEMSEGGYIQGAGDDTENWALGLTAPLFWEHKTVLMATPEPELPELIAHLVQQSAIQATQKSKPPRQVAPGLFISTLPLSEDDRPARQCRIVLAAQVSPRESWHRSPTDLHVGLGKSKVASRNLCAALPEICAFAARFLRSAPSTPDGRSDGSVLVACETGRDLSVATALAILCWCFDENGELVREEAGEGKRVFTKAVIKARLGTLMTAVPDANPNRTTLQSVNRFLMKREL